MIAVKVINIHPKTTVYQMQKLKRFCPIMLLNENSTLVKAIQAEPKVKGKDIKIKRCDKNTILITAST